MYRSIRSLMVALVFLVVAGALCAQETEQLIGVQEAKIATWGAVQRTIKYDYRVMNPTFKAAGKIDIYMPLPLESPRQEIHYLHLPETTSSMETALMRKAAADLTRPLGTATDFDKLISIHDYIISKIRYVRDNTWDPA